MKLTWRTEAPSVLLILGMFFASALVWPSVPDSIPVHWGISGEPDRFGSKWEGLLLLPVMSVGLYFLLIFLPKIDPRRANYGQFAAAYAIIRVLVIVVMAVIHVLVLLTALEYDIDMALAITATAGVMLIVLGVLLRRVKSTWFVGIRTPWTLSSEESWRKTHDIGGKLFVIMGLLMFPTGLIKSGWVLFGVLSVDMTIIVFLVFYSYIAWKKDPQARSAIYK